MRLSLILSSLILFGCGTAAKRKAEHAVTIQNDVEVLRHEELFQKMNADKNTLYVVNFWATWCKPCVEELPEFMEVNEQYASHPYFKMYLVSMDMLNTKDTKLIPYIQENRLGAEVVLLDDTKRMNEWIPKFDPDWSGSIPATVFYKNGEILHFTEGKMTRGDLENTITQNL